MRSEGYSSRSVCLSVCLSVCMYVCLSEHAILAVRAVRSITKDIRIRNNNNIDYSTQYMKRSINDIMRCTARGRHVRERG